MLDDLTVIVGIVLVAALLIAGFFYPEAVVSTATDLANIF